MKKARYFRCPECGAISRFKDGGKRSDVSLEEATAVILSGCFGRGRCGACIDRFFHEVQCKAEEKDGSLR